MSSTSLIDRIMPSDTVVLKLRNSSRAPVADPSAYVVTYTRYPRCRAASITRFASSDRYGAVSVGTASVMKPVRSRLRLRAATLTRYPVCSMTASTLARVASVMRPVPLMTLDAVFSDTPAAVATSRNVTRRRAAVVGEPGRFRAISLLPVLPFSVLPIASTLLVEETPPMVIVFAEVVIRATACLLRFCRLRDIVAIR